MFDTIFILPQAISSNHQGTAFNSQIKLEKKVQIKTGFMVLWQVTEGFLVDGILSWLFKRYKQYLKKKMKCLAIV